MSSSACAASLCTCVECKELFLGCKEHTKNLCETHRVSKAKRALFPPASEEEKASKRRVPISRDSAPPLSYLLDEYQKAKEAADRFNEKLERAERERAEREKQERAERKIKYQLMLEGFQALVDRSDEQCEALRSQLHLLLDSLHIMNLSGDREQAHELMERHGPEMKRASERLAEMQQIRKDRVRRLMLLEQFIETGLESFRDALLMEHALSSVQVALARP